MADGKAPGVHNTVRTLRGELQAAKVRLEKTERLVRIKAAGGADLVRPALTDVAWRRTKGVQEPEYNPIRLWAYFELDDTLQGVVTKIATEVTRAKGEPPASWRITPRFARKCAECGAEYDGHVDECEACGNMAFLDPHPTGQRILETFFRAMNADVPTDAILEDTVLCSLVLDNWFWWVREEPNPLNPDATMPVRVDVLDARFVRGMTDEEGRLWSNEYFCPSCYWTRRKPDSQKIKKGAPHAGQACPWGCGGTLAMTVWVQKDRGGRTVGRWTKRELIHAKRFGGSFRLYGLSPIVSLAIMVEALLYQGRYLISAYRDRRTWDGILTLPMDKEQGKEMLKEAQEIWAQNPAETSVFTLFTGAGVEGSAEKAQWLNLMGNFTDLAPLEFRQEYRKAIMARFGVGEVLTGAQTPGQLGHPVDALEASYDSIEGEQTHISGTINRELVPRFPPACHDWKFEFISPKQRDERLDWEIRGLKTDIVQKVNAMNVDIHAELNAEWEVEINEGPPPTPPPDVSRETVPTFGTPAELPPIVPPLPAARMATLEEFGEKTLTPRNIPPADAVRGVRLVEDTYARAVTDLYREALEKATRDAAGSVDPIVWREALNRRYAQARVEALTLTEQMAARGYVAAMVEEAQDIAAVRFEGADEAVLEEIASPNAFATTFRGFDQEARDAIVRVMEERFARPEGLDLRAMMEEMQEASDAATFRVERIARSETTNVTNAARITQFEKYAEPDDKYDFVTARDGRRCPICKAAEEGAGKLSAKERQEVERAGWDLNLLHGNPYTLNEVNALWWEHRSFHPYCRDTVRRRVALT